jgi:RNA polymerase sigma-70 factor (ECF subfamily)
LLKPLNFERFFCYLWVKGMKGDGVVRSSNEEDTVLLREASYGEVAAFERLYEKYAGFVLHIAEKMTGSSAEAEDICHEVFLEAWRKASAYDPERGSVAAWLAVRTRARCTDWIRRGKRWQEKAQLLGGWRRQEAAAEEKALASVTWSQLRAALQRIPLPQRDAVYGAYVEELTHTQLAERMNRPLGTVKSFVRSGLKQLRKQLAAEGWTASEGEKDHETEK